MEYKLHLIAKLQKEFDDGKRHTIMALMSTLSILGVEAHRAIAEMVIDGLIEELPEKKTAYGKIQSWYQIPEKRRCKELIIKRDQLAPCGRWFPPSASRCELCEIQRRLKG